MILLSPSGVESGSTEFAFRRVLDNTAPFLILPNNIVFFCSHCIYKLPYALMAYDNNKEVCDVIETKLNSVQMELSNRFEDFTEQVNNLVAYSAQEPETTTVVEDNQPSEQVVNKKQLTVGTIV